MISKRCLLLAFALLIGSLGCNRSPAPSTTTTAATDTLQRVRNGGVLRVGYIVWPPSVIKDPGTNELSGHNIDAIRAIANEADIQLEFIEEDWSTFVAALSDRRIDVMISGAYATIARAKQVAFTHPLFYLGNAIIVRADDAGVARPEDLNQEGLAVAVTLGTGEQAWAQLYLPKATLKSLAGSDLTLPLLEVLQGHVRAAITDAATARAFVASHAGVKALFLETPFNLTAVAWPLRHSDYQLRQFLDESIDYLESSGRLRSFEARYGATWSHRKYGWE